MTTINIEHLFKAQFGEDRVLWEVFRHRPVGYFIEVGAYDGVTLSNTYFLEQMGWGGLLVEPIPQLCQRAAPARPRSRVIQAAASKQGSQGTAKFTIAQNVPVLSFLKADEDHIERCRREGAQLVEIDVPLTTLNDVLNEQRRQFRAIPASECRAAGFSPRGFTLPRGHSAGETPAHHNEVRSSPSGSPWVPNVGWQIDLVSIDTEGCELDVLDGFDLERFKPRILVIENDRPTGDEIEPYLTPRGYRKFHRQKINDFYVQIADPADDLTLAGFDAIT